MNTDKRRLKIDLPTAEDEYTPAQRHAIDAALAESDEDIRCGRVFGPFDTHEAFIASLHRESAKLRARKKLQGR
jgi:hypothetical protein